MANNVMSSAKIDSGNPVQLLEYMEKTSVEENMMMLNHIKTSLLSSNPEENQEFQRFCLIFILKLLGQYNKCKTIAEKNLIKSIVETFKILFNQTVIDDGRVFLSAYYFLMNEIYDSNINNVKRIDEEYKLLITESMTALMNSLTDQVVLELYTRDSVFSLSTVVYVMCEIVRYEKFNTLRMAAMHCLLSISKIKCLETGNTVLMKKIADVLRFILPGTLSALGSAITEGETCNHKIIVLALQSFGKLLTLHLQDYDNSIQSSIMQDLPLESKSSQIPKNKWKNLEEAKQFLENNHYTVSWFKQTDLQLHNIVTNFVKLTCHSHDAVKKALIESFFNVVDVCSITIPKTISKLFEISIILQEDENPDIQILSQVMLRKFSLNSSQRILADNLEENFFDCVSSLTRVFNAFDEQQQISSLNLLIGYLKLFGTNHLSNVLQSHTHLHHLIQSLLHIAQLEQKNIRLIEEYMIQDLDMIEDQRTPWKNFYYFREESVKLKLEMVFETFVYCNVQDKISDILTDIFLKLAENRQEATTILNSLMLGVARYSSAADNMDLLTSVLNMYMDPEYWDVQSQVQQGILIHQVQVNLVQICLQIEGIGIIASVMKEKFKRFLFKCMFPVLIRAGSGHPLIKMAGMSAITSIAIACGNTGVTDLLIENSDYFSFHVIHRMRNSDPDESVLNVLAVMIKYSNLDIVPSIAHIIREAILPPRGQFREHNINAYLRVIQIFMKSLQKCLYIEARMEPIKSKLQRKIDYEEFQISNLNIDDYEEQGKTAQEMYEEDMQTQQEMEGDYDDVSDPYPKIELPLPHQLTADLVEVCLHFLPSKNQERQLLVIDIINQGLEIVRDYEDTLLPLVHKVWSPLSNRFSEDTDVLIINYSFQLFVTLARLSKDFIRSRSMNFVIPKLTHYLKEYSKLSYLQDRGAPYRCTKAYKLQLIILQQFGRALTDLEVSDSCINSVMESVVLYLNKKQPIPLQDAAKNFLRDVAKFDQELVRSMMVTQNGEEVKINAMAVLLSL